MHSLSPSNREFLVVTKLFKTEFIRKLSNFDFQWTKPLYKNGDYTGKILKISCGRSNFVKFDTYFLGLP